MQRKTATTLDRGVSWLARRINHNTALAYTILMTFLVTVVAVVTYGLFSLFVPLNPPGLGWIIVFGYFIYRAYRDGQDDPR